jgi:hypothetical protein
MTDTDDATDKPTGEPTELPKRDKPLLILMRGNAVTVEELADAFERFTGRKPTPEEMAAARK